MMVPSRTTLWWLIWTFQALYFDEDDPNAPSHPLRLFLILTPTYIWLTCVSVGAQLHFSSCSSGCLKSGGVFLFCQIYSWSNNISDPSKSVQVQSYSRHVACFMPWNKLAACLISLLCDFWKTWPRSITSDQIRVFLFASVHWTFMSQESLLQSGTQTSAYVCAVTCLSTHLSINLSVVKSPPSASLCVLARSLAIASAPPFRNLTKFSPTNGPMAYMPGPSAATTLFVKGSTSMGFLRHVIVSSGLMPSDRPLSPRKERLGWAPIRTSALEIWTTVCWPDSDSRMHFRSGRKATTLWRGKLR